MADYKFDIDAAREKDPHVLVGIARTCDTDVVVFTADRGVKGTLEGIDPKWTKSDDMDYVDTVSDAAKKYFYGVTFGATNEDTKTAPMTVKILTSLNEYNKNNEDYDPIIIHVKVNKKKKKKTRATVVIDKKSCILEAIVVDMDLPPSLEIRSVTIYGSFTKGGETTILSRTIDIPKDFVAAQNINPLDFL